MLVVGTIALGWLLLQRAATLEGRPPAAAVVADLPLPAGSRIEQVALDGSRLLLLVRGPQQQEYLAVVNATTGQRQALLRVVPEPP